MPTLEELLKKHKIVVSDSASSGPRSKLLAQADRMLKQLNSYKAEDELDGNSSQYWWSPQSVDGKRRVAMRYGGKIVENTGVYVDNTLPAVKAIVEAYKNVILDSDDATWADEEERRRKK
jgi:hypothetical protein